MCVCVFVFWFQKGTRGVFWGVVWGSVLYSVGGGGVGQEIATKKIHASQDKDVT